MLFDATEWAEVTANKWLGCTTGKLEIRTSGFSVLYIRQLGVEAIASSGHHHKVRVGKECEYMVAIPDKDATVYVHTPTNPVLVVEAEKFTNLERKPQESGTLLEVKKAIRELQLNAMMQRRELAAKDAERASRERAERVERKAEVKASGVPDPVEAEAEAENEAENVEDNENAS